MGNDKTWCPRCDQGRIIKAVIKITKEQLFLCEECEATWLSTEEIGKSQWVDFGTHMNSKNLKPLWSEIDVQNQINL